MHSLSASELARHYKINPKPVKLLEWIIKGGYPEIYEHKLEPNRFFSDYVATYIERDVRQLINIRNLREFDQFMRLLQSVRGRYFP